MRRAAAAVLAAVHASARGARPFATAPFHLKPGPFLKRDLGELRESARACKRPFLSLSPPHLS